MRQRLVLGRQRRRGHLRDHEAGVDAAILDQERRQAGEVGIHQQRDAALRQRADLGDREREVVGGEGDRLGVEVAAGQDFVRRPRTPADCRRPRWPRSRASPPRGAAGRGRRPSPAAGSAGCRGPAPAGNPCARRGCRCRRAARGRSPPHRPGHGDRAPRGCAHRTACRCRGRRRPTSAPATNAAASDALGREQAGERERRRHLRAVEQRQAFLRPEHERREAGARERLARRHDVAAIDVASPSPISTADRCASGARSPEAPTEPCAGMHGHDAGVGERDAAPRSRSSGRRSSRARAMPP